VGVGCKVEWEEFGPEDKEGWVPFDVLVPVRGGHQKEERVKELLKNQTAMQVAVVVEKVAK